eukprot:6925957-Prymnesium_polylepis.1
MARSAPVVRSTLAKITVPAALPRTCAVRIGLVDVVTLRPVPGQHAPQHAIRAVDASWSIRTRHSRATCGRVARSGAAVVFVPTIEAAGAPCGRERARRAHTAFLCLRFSCVLSWLARVTPQQLSILDRARKGPWGAIFASLMPTARL